MTVAGPVNHGTKYAYDIRLCRCDKCRAANTMWSARRRARRRAERIAAGWEPKVGRTHGTRSCYRVCTDGADGGTCDACRQVENEYHREWRRSRKGAA